MPDPINPFLVPQPKYMANQKDAYPQMSDVNYMQMYDEKSFMMNPNRMLSKYGSNARLPEDMNQSNINLFSNETGPEVGSTTQGFMYPSEVGDMYGLGTNRVTPKKPFIEQDISTELMPELYSNVTVPPTETMYSEDDYNADQAANNALLSGNPTVMSNKTVPSNIEQLMTQEGDINNDPLGLNIKTTQDNQTTFNPDIIKMDNKGILNNPYTMPKTGPMPPTDFYQQSTQNSKNKFMSPENYYMAKAGLDSVALFNNMIQPQPPSLQMKIPHMERVRMDRTPYETGRTNVQEMGTTAYRQMREGAAQASDLMKGLSAVTSGTQEQLRGIAVAEAQGEDAVRQQNQQIAMQENQLQTQTLNQEAATNYQLQQQAQQVKDQMVSAALAGLTATGGAFAKYTQLKDIAEKQNKISKESALSNHELQSSMLKYQMTKDEMDSDEYKTAKTASWKEEIKNAGNAMILDEKYKEIQPIYGENASEKYLDWVERAQDEDFNAIHYNIKEFAKAYPEGKAPTPKGDVKADAQALNRYNEGLATYNKYKDNPQYKHFDTESKYWKDVRNKLDQTAHDAKFSEQYKKRKGLMSMEDFVSNVDAIDSRTRQSLL